ncbi:hypothetical protein WJX82_006219 [Trebouxia sp. C0006]
MTSKVLSGVVALVSFRPDGTFNFKKTISTKLTDLGARVTSRFSKDVTHVVFQKRLKPTPEQQLAEASDLRALYDKAAKADNPVHIVSLLWVERSAADKARAMEQTYTLQRPTDANLLQPGAGITPGSSGRKRSRRTMQPKDTKELELDVTDAMYSSSQQINGQQKPGWDVGEVCSPALQKHDQRQKGQQALTKHACHTGKRKRQDAQAESDDCCTPDFSTAQTARTVKGAARGSGSSMVHPKTTGKQDQGEVRSTEPVLLPGGSSRFSTRHLKQKVEAKLPVTRATPIGLPPTPFLPVTQQTVPIPVPEFTKVVSPWTSTPKELSQPFPDGQQLPPGCVPSSAEMPPPRAATSCNPATHSQAAAADDGHQETSAAKLAGLQSAVPAAAATTAAAPWDGSDAAAARDDTEMLEADDEEDGEADPACTTSGCLGLSCVEPEVQELARNAVRALRGVRLCAEGHEEGRLTHLVLGQQRRTLKVLLAIAAGAVLVTPDWLTASLEAGEWLPEAPFLAQGRFAQAALAAREVQSSERPQPLHGKKVYVHVADAAKKGPSTGNGGPLRRLVAALGGKIVGAKACNLCIVSGGCSRPANLSTDITAVREEWLLKGAEKYKLESERVHAVK